MLRNQLSSQVEVNVPLSFYRKVEITTLLRENESQVITAKKYKRIL